MSPPRLTEKQCAELTQGPLELIEQILVHKFVPALVEEAYTQGYKRGYKDRAQEEEPDHEG